MKCSGCDRLLKSTDAYCHGEKRICQSCYENVDRGVTPLYLEHGRCDFVPPGEPIGLGVSDGDVRAWRDRHQCAASVKWCVEPLVSDHQHRRCDVHVVEAIGVGARVLNIEACEAQKSQQERSRQVLATRNELYGQCARCAISFDPVQSPHASVQYNIVAEKIEIVCERCFIAYNSGVFVQTNVAHVEDPDRWLFEVDRAIRRGLSSPRKVGD